MTDDNDNSQSTNSILRRFERFDYSYPRKIIISVIVLVISIVISITVLASFGQNRFLVILVALIFYAYLLTPRDSTILTIVTSVLFFIYNELYSEVFPSNLVSPIVPITVFSSLAYILGVSINRRRKLEQRVNKLAQFDEYALEGVCVLSRSIIVDHNFALMRLLNLTGTELIGESIFDYIIDEDKEQIHGYMIEAIDFMLNTKLKTHDSEIEVTLFYRVFDESKGTLSIIEKSKGDQYVVDHQKFFGFYDTISEIAEIGIIERDMTELSRALHVLRNNGIEDLESYLKENLEEAKYLYSLIKITKVNKEAMRIFQVENEASLTDHFIQNLDPRRTDFIISLDRIYRGIENYERTMDYINNKGESKKLLVKSRYPTAEKPNYITVIIDLTETYEREKELEYTKYRYETIFNNAPLGLITVKNSKMLMVNPYLLDIYGYSSADELIGKDVGILQPIELRDEMKRRGSNREKGLLEPESYKSLGLKKDGNIFPIEVIVSQLQLEGGISTLAFIRDVTEQNKLEISQKFMEQKMMESHKLESLAVLAGGIVHDFNNLLLGLRGGVDLMNLTGNLTTEQSEILSIISNASNQATDLIQQLLAYTGKSKLIPEIINLSETIKELESFIKLSISKDIRINYIYDYEIPNINVNATQLKQVIINSLLNSSEAINHSSGMITVSTGYEQILNADDFMSPDKYCPLAVREGEFVTLTISDNGTGISKDDLPRIFDPFFSGKPEGKGLGLSVIQGILNQYQGFIVLRTIAGSGTDFTYYFPIYVTKMIPKIKEKKKIPNDISTGTILICDDEPMVIQVLNKQLEILGYNILIADNGKDAVELFKQNNEEINFVILDLNMPIMSGKETLDELLKIRGDIPVILSSGYSEESISDFSNYENLVFLGKPYTMEKLKSIIDSLNN